MSRKCGFCGQTKGLQRGGPGGWMCSDFLACANAEMAAFNRANPPCSDESPRQSAPSHPFVTVEDGTLWDVLECPHCGRRDMVAKTR